LNGARRAKRALRFGVPALRVGRHPPRDAVGESVASATARRAVGRRGHAASTTRSPSIFARLSEDERIQLGPKMKRRSYKSGEILVEQGSVAQALFILSAGVLVANRNMER